MEKLFNFSLLICAVTRSDAILRRFRRRLPTRSWFWKHGLASGSRSRRSRDVTGSVAASTIYSTDFRAKSTRRVEVSYSVWRRDTLSSSSRCVISSIFIHICYKDTSFSFRIISVSILSIFEILQSHISNKPLFRRISLRFNELGRRDSTPSRDSLHRWLLLEGRRWFRHPRDS